MLLSPKSLSRRIRLSLLSALLCVSVAPLSSAWELQAPRKPRSKKQTQAKPLPPLPAGPLTPFNLDQTPASPPQVSYQAGQLTITAQNSTLGDILRAVRSKTGATFDIPPGATERVVGQLGPGPPREVIASLLNGSRFDYVMLGSATNPGAIDQLILTPKSGTTAAGGAQPAAATAAGQPLPGQPAGPMQAADEQDRPDTENDTADESADVPQENQENNDQTDQAESEGPQDASSPQNGQQVRTPEQLLQELQQQQRLQQQQQQQPGQPQIVAPVPPPPGQPPNPPEQE
jgi:hypothetical protein